MAPRDLMSLWDYIYPTLKIADNSQQCILTSSTAVQWHIPVKPQMQLHVLCVIPERPQTGHLATIRFLDNSYINF